MPGQTPVYGFIYPCPDETVSPADFSTLANQIDAKLLQLDADYVLMLNRKNYDDTSSIPSQVVAAGVDTVLTDPALSYVIPMSGFYVVTVRINTSGAATVNMRRIRVRQNAVVRFGATANTENNNLIAPSATGPIVATAGDVISLTYLYNGAGTESVAGQLSVRMITRTA